MVRLRSIHVCLAKSRNTKAHSGTSLCGILGDGWLTLAVGQKWLSILERSPGALVLTQAHTHSGLSHPSFILAMPWLPWL